LRSDPDKGKGKNEIKEYQGCEFTLV
jgi:hypothetical protein